MIYAVTAYNYLGEHVRMELAYPEKSGFLIYNIEGIGPPKANINISEVANFDGGFFNSSRATTRNILLSLKHMGQPMVEDTRHRSYKYFPLQKPIRLVFETDRRTTEIYGYVESNEPAIFSKEQHTKISILCPRPYFQSVRNYITVFSGIDSMFEFPFSNESLTEKLIIMSQIKATTVETIWYDGDVETGVVIHIHAIGDVTNPAIYNLDTKEEIKLTTTMSYGDDIVISTVQGDRFIQKLSNGVVSNIINSAMSFDRLPDWFKLRKGHNTFAYTADYGVLNMTFNMSRHILYEGV